MHACMHVCTHVCVCVRMSMYARMYVYVRVPMYVYVCTGQDHFEGMLDPVKSCSALNAWRISKQCFEEKIPMEIGCQNNQHAAFRFDPRMKSAAIECSSFGFVESKIEVAASRIPSKAAKYAQHHHFLKRASSTQNGKEDVEVSPSVGWLALAFSSQVSSVC